MSSIKRETEKSEGRKLPEYHFKKFPELRR